MKLRSFNNNGKQRYEIVDNSNPIAFAVVTLDAGDGNTWISDLLVNKSYRGRGLASLLIKKIIKDFPGKLYLRAYSLWDDGLSDDELTNMYKRFGFKQIQGKSKYYMVRENNMQTFRQHITEADDLNKPLRTGLIPYYIDENNKIWVAVMIPSDPKFGGSEPQFSKGKFERGLTQEQNAIKEAQEELGYIHKPIYKIKLLTTNYLNRIVWYYVKVDDIKLNKPHYESKEAYWIRTKELKNKIVKWQRPILELLKQTIKNENI
jgi:8-oxo-dGTP pyrophosphatase MutT (NUDIX family)/predicted GNAT family acetyltransferase